MHKEQVPLPNIFQYFDGKENICKTSYSKVIKGELPFQAVVNNMYVDETPTQLASLEKLEQVLTDWQFSILQSFLVFVSAFIYIKKWELYVLFIATKHGLKAEQRTKRDAFSLLVCCLFSHGFMLNKQIPACDHCSMKDSRMPAE